MKQDNTRTTEEIAKKHLEIAKNPNEWPAKYKALRLYDWITESMEEYASQFKAAAEQANNEEYVIRKFDTNNYYWCKCENCGWEDSSEYAAGGHSIGDTGDYSDAVCPICSSDKIDGETNMRLPEPYDGVHFVKIPLNIFLAPYQKAVKRVFELEDEKAWNTVMMKSAAAEPQNGYTKKQMEDCHMAGQLNAGCKEPSASEAMAYVSGIQPAQTKAEDTEDTEICTSCENKFLTEIMKQDSGENYFCQTCYSELSPIMKAEYEQSVKQDSKEEQETYSREQLISSCKVIGRHLYKIFGMEDDKTETNIDYFIINNILPSLPKAEPQGQEIDEFLNYCKEARNKFVGFIQAFEWRTDLRTEIDDLLICFDQMKDRLSKSPTTVREGHGWISVEDSPLYTKDANGNWECTENGEKSFFAAVHYNDHKRPNERNLWWIRHCVIEDGIGLCVVGSDENEPAGWQLDDVTHYKIVDLNPPTPPPGE